MKLRAGDFAVIAVILIIALTVWTYPFFKGEGENLRVSISQNGEEVAFVPLHGTERVFKLAGCEVGISQGRVQVTASDCKDGVCLKTGEVNRAGESIICVPNRVVVTISGSGEIDVVAR